VQQGGPGEPWAEPTLIDISKRNPDGTDWGDPRTGKKKLLFRVPTLDTQFTIPRPVTSATITFHGLCAFNSVAFFGRRAENFTSSQKWYEIVTPSGLIFPHQFHKTNWDPLTMKKPPETTFSVGSLHPMIQSYQKISELWKDLQDPQAHMPNEGIFDIPVSTFFKSNEQALPFWDEQFPEDAKWDWFLKTIPIEKQDASPDIWNEEPTEGEEDNHFMRMGNPYMMAVKHDKAAEDAKKKKLPVWVGPKKFRFQDIPKDNRTLPNFNLLNWYTHNSYIEIPMSQRMALYFDSRAEKGITDSISSVGQVLTGTLGLTGIGGIIGGLMGGPLGFAFGAAVGKYGKAAIEAIGKILGTIIGMGAGFAWNSSGKNSLPDNAKRQLPGFMCLLPKDKLELYLESLFHMDTPIFGGRHARLPYNSFTTADRNPIN
jgi:hypothetical protein